MRFHSSRDNYIFNNSIIIHIGKIKIEKQSCSYSKNYVYTRYYNTICIFKYMNIKDDIKTLIFCTSLKYINTFTININHHTLEL